MNTYKWKSIKCKQTTDCKQIADCKQTADCNQLHMITNDNKWILTYENLSNVNKQLIVNK